MPDVTPDTPPDPAADLAARSPALVERDAALEEAAQLERDLGRAVRQRDAEAKEADRLHELLRRLHAEATTAKASDLIATSIDVRHPRRRAAD